MDEHAVAKLERKQAVDAVAFSKAKNKLVVAGPGTGKTYLFREILAGRKNTLTLTFVNSLVEDLSLELFGMSTVKTLHGFARSELSRLSGKNVKIFPKLSKIIRQDAQILIDEDIDYERIFHKRIDDKDHLEFYKNRKDYYDYYGFSDVVYALVLLFEKNSDKIPSYEQIVVDEFQDFNDLEVSLIDLLAKKSPILLAGDDDQALYESLKSASPLHIRKRFHKDIKGYVCFPLPFCSRSTRVIVEAANDIIKKAKEKDFLSGRIDKPYRYFPCPEMDKTSSQYPKILYTRLFDKQIPWAIQKYIEGIARDVRSKRTILILSPTGNQCKRIHEGLVSRGFRNIAFNERAEFAEPSLLDGLKLLLLDANDNLGWRIIAQSFLSKENFIELLRRTKTGQNHEKLIDYVDLQLKRRIKRLVATLRKVKDGKMIDRKKSAELLDELSTDPHSVALYALRDELQDSRIASSDPGIRKIPIQITTFQSAKGLTADYVIIANLNDRYCIRDRTMSNQDVCSFLVALTRARNQVYLLSTQSKSNPIFLSWIGSERILELPISWDS
ncbi:MAG TPA: AAA family ATPase [Candidatus Aminicenantes bacterium]|nr:AAA family ATPase [Candidatus Aminicenantes bacterium]HRY64027.1 AAA family ATPase [Candidatus Aminicenantes bacterium]HRZ70940.1 AAA family ATPase [Candidatus Aminicenantes bacterium]